MRNSGPSVRVLYAYDLYWECRAINRQMVPIDPLKTPSQTEHIGPTAEARESIQKVKKWKEENTFLFGSHIPVGTWWW